MRKRCRRPSRAYAAIPNAAMRDETISIKARGLLALMMTYSDDWVFHFSHLQKVACIGRDALRGLFSELERAGYIVRERIRGESGQLRGTEWVILDLPVGTTSMVVEDDDQPDDANDPGDEDPRRQPENQGIGNNAHDGQDFGDVCNYTDSLKNRPPEKPTVGFSAPLRRSKGKKKKKEESPLPPDRADLEAAERDRAQLALKNRASCIQSGREYLCREISAEKARELVCLGMVTAEQCRAVGIRL